MQKGDRAVTAPRRHPITIRPATARDAAFILGLLPRLVEIPLPAHCRARHALAATRTCVAGALKGDPPNQHFFIATTGNHRRMGFLQLAATRSFLSGVRECHVSNLVIAAQYAGRGAGRALLAQAERWARAHRCALLTLNVFPGNTRARALYERAGFTTDILRLGKHLAPRR